MTKRRVRFITPAGVWPWVAAAFLLGLAAPASSGADPVAQFTFSPASPFTGETVTFTSSSTGVTSQSWDLDGDRVCNDATGAVAQRSFPTSGAYWVALCVSDEVGQTASQMLKVTVQNRPPVAAFTYAPPAPFTGDPIVLTSVSADPDGPIAGLQWDLNGDGVFTDASGPTATVSFPAAGLHPVALAVTDTDGATTVALQKITVREPPPEPISPFPVVSMLAAIGTQGTTVRELVVHAPAGARIRVRCRGRGCPFRSYVKPAGRARSSRIVRIHRFRKALLRPGALIEIFVTKQGAMGKYTRFEIRRGQPPRRTDRCLRPGSKRPTRCPA
ncbi:MAG: hypothetical protein C5B48_16160 [Candidatus Rokuibacteriota bacterium]|nr:MAG: hypothetical protein C5B48_16160 [Candidatus Rokubacteria bacterium]